MFLGVDFLSENLKIIKLNFRPKSRRKTEYLIKWSGLNENGDPWDNTWEPFKSVISPKLYANYGSRRNGSFHPWMQKNLPFEVRRKLQEHHEVDSASAESFSSSDEDEVESKTPLKSVRFNL